MARPTNEPENYVAIGRQAEHDQAATTFTFPRYLDGSGFEVESDTQRERRGGDGQEVGLSYRGKVTGDPAIVANADPIITGLLLTAVQGQDDMVDPGVNTEADHVIVPAALLPYYTIEQRFGDIVERVLNCQCNQLQIEFEAGRPYKLTANFLSGGDVLEVPIANALTPTRETGDPHFYPGSVVTIDGSADQPVTKGSISIQRGLDDGIQTTKLTRDDLVALAYDLDVNVTRKYTDRGLYAKARSYDGAGKVPIKLSTGALLVERASGVNSMELDLPNLDFVGAAVNKLNPDGQTMYLDLAAMNRAGPTPSLTATIRNTRLTAY